MDMIIEEWGGEKKRAIRGRLVFIEVFVRWVSCRSQAGLRRTTAAISARGWKGVRNASCLYACYACKVVQSYSWLAGCRERSAGE